MNAKVNETRAPGFSASEPQPQPWHQREDTAAAAHLQRPVLLPTITSNSDDATASRKGTASPKSKADSTSVVVQRTLVPAPQQSMTFELQSSAHSLSAKISPVSGRRARKKRRCSVLQSLQTISRLQMEMVRKVSKRKRSRKGERSEPYSFKSSRGFLAQIYLITRQQMLINISCQRNHH